MELLKGVVRVKNKDSLHLTAVIVRFPGKKIQHQAVIRILGRCVLVHFAPSGEQPFKIQGGVVEHQALQEIIARLVAAGKNMGDASARYGKSVRKLSLREIFGLQKL